MPDHGIAPIKPVTLSNLQVWKLTCFTNRKDTETYAPVTDLDFGELYQTKKQYRATRISEHFTAGDFARSGTKKYDYARIHHDLVYELEKIRTFFGKNVNIKVGYHTHADWLNLEPIEKNYVAGLAARISVSNLNGPLLAKFAIFIASSKDMSISVGEKDIILAVHQKQTLITSHIGEGRQRSSSRVARERTTKPLQHTYNYFLGKHRPLLAKLDDQYANLRSELIREKPRIYSGFRRSKAYTDKIMAEQRLIILDLHQNHGLAADFIVNLFFYSDFYNLHRTYVRLAAYFYGMAKTKAGHQFYAAQEIGNILCPGLAAFRNRFDKRADAIHPCSSNPYDIEIPILLNNQTTDNEVMVRLKNLVKETTKGINQIPRSQQGPVLGANRKENRPDTAKPDKPTDDITGRYELKGKNFANYIGETLVINQTGIHFEGYHSYLHRPPKLGEIRNVNKLFYRIHGRQVESQYIGYYYTKQWAGHEITIIRKNSNTLLLQFRKGSTQPYSELEFERVSRRSTHLGLDVAGGSELIRFHEWMPLLKRQIATIEKYFSGKGLENLDKLLNEYYDTSSDNNKRTYAKEIDDLFEKAFHDPKNGIHPTDNVLAAYYISFLLTSESWVPEGETRKITRYYYLKRLVEEQQVRKIKGQVGTIRDYLNLPDLSEEETPKRFTYNVSIELTGFSFKAGGGGGAFMGILTIEKTGGEDGVWKIDKDKKKNEVEYFIAIAGVAAGWGWNTSIKGKAEFADSVEWLPEDFSGWGQLVRGSLTASYSVGKVGGSGFFIIHDRNRGTFRAEFLDTKLGLQKKADKPKFEGELSLYKMYIGEDDATADAVRIEAAKIPKDYNQKFGTKRATFNGHDSAFLTPDARQLLRIMCASELVVLERDDVKITVEGHTDRTGDTDHNECLAENRAKNVKLALRDIMGRKLIIADAGIKAKGLGESLAESEAGDYDTKENPSYRGVRILINGRVVIKLDAAFAK